MLCVHRVSEHSRNGSMLDTRTHLNFELVALVGHRRILFFESSQLSAGRLESAKFVLGQSVCGGVYRMDGVRNGVLV